MTDDYIRRSDALKVIETANSMASRLLEATMKLCVTMDRIAAADIKPVVHGRWIRYGAEKWYCSECELTIETEEECLPHFCKDCGAKMDGDGE